MPAAGGISKVHIMSGHPSFGNLSLAPLACRLETDTVRYLEVGMGVSKVLGIGVEV